ncbi:MAG: type II/IV secretion system protein [Candidatus Wildermuthbacteria bacterium]|nr:type II/IV secretion system protein [Candidatus Wildermuthbacteria bacterium]
MGILDFLVQKNIIGVQDAKTIRAEAETSGKKPEDILLEKGMLKEESLFQLESELFGLPLRRVDAEDVPLKALELISEESARYYKMVPIAAEGNLLEVGMVYPKDTKAQGALQFLSRQGNFSYKISFIAPSTFEALMKQYRSLKGEVRRALEELEQEVKTQKKPGEGKRQDNSRIVEEAPVTKMVAVIVRNAVEGGASDIHIEPTRENLRVRFRFLGELHSSLFLPIKVHPAVIARIKILSNLKIDETRIPQDGRFSMIVDNRNIDFRVAIFPTALGEKVALRILDPESGAKNFQDLGIEGTNLNKIQEAMKRPFGLILVTGPTGSGKTTTLYTMLRELNNETVNIVSLEDPVEYLLPGMNQSQVRPEVNYDFAQGLRQILRQDPDIIMVGEVRDSETATLVIHAALTGHLVLSTLHTNNAFGVIPRLVDMGVEKYLIPVTLAVAVAQRLVRKLCINCREAVKAKKGMKELIMKETANASPDFQKKVEPYLKDLKLYQPKGCKKCGSSGYSGRLGVYEALSMTDALAGIILEDPSETKVAEEAKRQGMVTMFQDGILKALDGMTTIEEVLRVAED